MTSIRHFLIMALLLSMAMVTLSTGIWTYKGIQSDVDHLLDAELVEAAHILQILIEGEHSHTELQLLQEALLALPEKTRVVMERDAEKDDEEFHPEDDLKYTIHRVFQVWNESGQLLLRSQNAPQYPLSDDEVGFSEGFIENIRWRVYTLSNKSQKLRFQVAQRSDIRSQLAKTIARDHMYHFLFMCPIIAILIWMIVGYALRHLQETAREMNQRDKNNLDPVVMKKVPIEIQPMIAALNRLFERLKNAFEREKRFTGDAAHELRTPLAALKTQTQVALRTPDDSERNDTLKTIIQCVDRCNHVVEQLLTLSRQRPDEPINDPTQVNINTIAMDVISDLAHMAVAKDIDIGLNAEEKADPIIFGNETSIRILFRNLIDNAIRYTPQAGEVTINTHVVNDKVIFNVTDTGPGIPEEKRKRVFERFYRELGTKASGSGLGLSIVKQIIQLHNAKIKLFTPDNGKGLGINVTFARFKSK